MRNVYLHEFNIVMGNTIYLPNVSGMLRAYAETKPEIQNHYRFMPFIFVRSEPMNIVAEWREPSVLAFSASMWNHELNLVLAHEAKRRFPEAVIIFGGPHIPHNAELFLRRNPSIDIVVRREGEETFTELLLALLDSRDVRRVHNVAFLDPDSHEYVYTAERPLLDDLDRLPSPYLSGLYDDLLRNRGDREYQVILETNRGCPFGCAFCYWGDRIKKVRKFSLSRIEQEVAWLGRMQIPYVFGADANFGMIPRDRDIAQLFVEEKQRSGFPRSFRVCYGKNAEDRIYDVAATLDKAALTKGVTVSFQSTDPLTLENIGRGNISLTTYRNLLARYRKANIPVYTELILGLPGETYTSFSQGLNEIFEAGLYDQIGIFLCTALPNTPMTDPQYVAQYGIVSKKIELVEFHASRRGADEVPEYEDIVVATDTMPFEDWKHAVLLAWMAQLLHGLKLGFFVALYLHRQFGIKFTTLFEYILRNGTGNDTPLIKREIASVDTWLDELCAGSPQCVFLDRFGEISWQIEEASFLRIAERPMHFYNELARIVRDMLDHMSVTYDEQELHEVMVYQVARTAHLGSKEGEQEFFFTHSVPEYMEKLLNGDGVPMTNTLQRLVVQRKGYKSKEDFARTVIWYGRRDSRAIEPAYWYNAN